MKTVILTIGCVVGQNVSENEDRNARRYDQFMEMTKVNDEQKGFLKNGRLTGKITMTKNCGAMAAMGSTGATGL